MRGGRLKTGGGRREVGRWVVEDGTEIRTNGAQRNAFSDTTCNATSKSARAPASASRLSTSACPSAASQTPAAPCKERVHYHNQGAIESSKRASVVAHAYLVLERENEI